MKKVISIIRLFILVLWSLLMIFFGSIATLLTLSLKTAPFVARKIWSPLALKIMGAKIIIHGREKIDPSLTYIWMSNHSSYLDIPVLLVAAPYSLYFLAKKELARVPFLGFYIRLAGAIFIDRNNSQAAQESIALAGRKINAGKSVILFPEGTSKAGEEIIPFKKGGIFLAKSAEVPILPVRIKGTGDIWPSTNMTSVTPGLVEVFIGAPVKYSLPDKESINQAARDLKVLINTLDKK